MKLTLLTFARNTNLTQLAHEKTMFRGLITMKKIFGSIALLGLMINAIPAYAGAGTEGASFLDIPVGAGPAAMGSAYTALANNAYAPVWNPAGLGMLRGNELAGQHVSYLES